MLPRNVTPDDVAAVMVPEMLAPDCVRVHAVVPGPDESDAVPEYVPVSTTAATLGDAGEFEDELPQPVFRVSMPRKSRTRIGHVPVERVRDNESVTCLTAERASS